MRELERSKDVIFVKKVREGAATTRPTLPYTSRLVEEYSKTNT